MNLYVKCNSVCVDLVFKDLCYERELCTQQETIKYKIRQSKNRLRRTLGNYPALVTILFVNFL